MCRRAGLSNRGGTARGEAGRGAGRSGGGRGRKRRDGGSGETGFRLMLLRERKGRVGGGWGLGDPECVPIRVCCARGRSTVTADLPKIIFSGVSSLRAIFHGRPLAARGRTRGRDRVAV